MASLTQISNTTLSNTTINQTISSAINKAVAPDYHIYWYIGLFLFFLIIWLKLSYANEEEFKYTKIHEALLIGAIPGFFIGGISGSLFYWKSGGLYWGMFFGIILGAISLLLITWIFNFKLWLRKRKEEKYINKKSNKRKA